MDTFEGQNWGVLKTVKVIELSKLSFSEFQNPIDFDDISIDIGYDFEEIPHIFESAGFSDLEGRESGNMVFNKKVGLTIPKLRTESSAFLKTYENRKLALLVTDMNDESHLVYPVRMSRQRNIPGQASGLNATRVEFTGQWNGESPIVTNVT